jgi:hypothetical protein
MPTFPRRAAVLTAEPGDLDAPGGRRKEEMADDSHGAAESGRSGSATADLNLRLATQFNLGGTAVPSEKAEKFHVIRVYAVVKMDISDRRMIKSGNNNQANERR